MSLVPALWLGLALAVAFRRPGWLLGCVFASNSFASFYGVAGAGQPLLLGYLVLLGALALFQMTQYRSWGASIFRAEMYLVLFFALYLISPVYAASFPAASMSSTRFLTVCGGYYLIGRILFSFENYSDRLIFDFGISVVVLTLAFSYLGVLNELTLGGGRLAVGGSSVGFSKLFDISIGFLLFYLLSNSKKNSKIWKTIALGAILVLGYYSILNSSRGTVLSLAFAACVFGGIIVMTRGRSRGRKKVILSLTFLILAISIGVTQFVVGTSDDRLGAGIARLTQNFGSSGYRLDGSSAERLVLMRQGWELFTNAPFVGNGAGSYNYITSDGYPHNLFVELLAETGLVGTILFSVMLMAYGILGVRLLKFTDFASPASIAMGMFLIAFAHIQVSGALWTAKPLFFSMGAMAAMFGQALNGRLRQEVVEETPDSAEFPPADRERHTATQR